MTTQFNPIRTLGQEHRRGSVFMRAKHPPLWRHFLFALLLFGCLIVSACSGASAPTQQTTPTVRVPAFASKLKPMLEAKMKELQVPGAIVFVDLPGQGSWVTTLGTSNLQTGTPMNLHSYMRVGSITKTWTATIILQLVDRGRIHLDDPISAYLSGVPNGTHISIRELLNMTSGLFSYGDDQNFEQAFYTQRQRNWTPQALLEAAFHHPPYFAPGTGWHYSNTNYILLGLLIERITHLPMAMAYQQFIFEPLGMRESSFPQPTSTALPDPHPQGYSRQTLDSSVADATNWNPSWTWTAGEGISTLHDLKIWVKALATGTLLHQQTQEERLGWVTVSPKAKYGLGIFNAGGVLGHDGDIPGFQSFIGYQPQKGATVIVLTTIDYSPDLKLAPANELEKVIQKELL